jgi:hypothetical protein
MSDWYCARQRRPDGRSRHRGRLASDAPGASVCFSTDFPEGYSSFGALGSGWVGVYRWRHQSATRGGGRLGNDALLFQYHDLLLLHLDADVAGSQYAHGAIAPHARDEPIPCEHGCPPAADTTNALRKVLLSWCGEVTTPACTVICMPRKEQRRGWPRPCFQRIQP